MKINNQYIREIAIESGADLAGIATIDRFIEAPEGSHPVDVLPSCRSVIVLCCRFPADAINQDAQTYTKTRNEMAEKMNNMAAELSKKISKLGFESKAVKSINSSFKNGRYRGPISLKHAAVLAGLGKIGKNTLLVNNKFGNMVWLSAVLTSIELEPDPIARYKVCNDKCTLCISSCPASALDRELMNQRKCSNYAFKTINGRLEIQCWKCRQICPNHLGIE